ALLVLLPPPPDALLPHPSRRLPAPPSLPTRRSSDLDWRDPWVIYVEDAGQWVMILGTRKAGPKTQLSGSTVYFTSTDHETWEFQDRKSTRLNSSHVSMSYTLFCLQQNYSIDPVRITN